MKYLVTVVAALFAFSVFAVEATNVQNEKAKTEMNAKAKGEQMKANAIQNRDAKKAEHQKMKQEHKALKQAKKAEVKAKVADKKANVEKNLEKNAK